MPLDVDASAASSFGLAEEYEAHETPWHRHAPHQLIYAASGVLRLEVEDAQWILPPQRAAFIAAGAQHRTRSGHTVSLRTLYLPAARVAVPPATRCSVFPVSALCRELLLEGSSLGPGLAEGLEALALFELVATLVPRWLAESLKLRLPRPKSEELRRAVEHALNDLQGANACSAARAAGTSERSLTRRFREETGLSWRDFLRTARILRALELLANPSVRITEAGFAVGFDSHAGFSRSFRQLCGESPSDYQRRVARGS